MYALHFLKGVIPVRAVFVFVDAASVITCCMSANPQVSEKRHLVEVALVREIIERYKIHLLHISGEANPADQLTKFAPNGVHVSEIDFAQTTANTSSTYVKVDRSEKSKTKDGE